MLAGYSYKSSQYGLVLDNVAGYELVLPNGTIKHVTQKDKDLWFGLRVSRQGSIQVGDTDGLQSQGGLNNFVCHQFRVMVNV
jgi:FAD/FMN-containing dehydrogenase